MRLSKSYFYTIREDLKDEDSISSNLLTRAGFMKRNSAGVYMMLPLGFKTITNIENIIREEMNRIDSQEMLMPSLIPMEIYETSNRDQIIGESMFKLEDRFGRPFALGPTHEELFSIAGKSAIRSYKHMPFSLYQFQTKFRDEKRARYGLIRVREFIMKDAYTFDIDNESCDVSYQAMKQAYIKIFDRLKLNYHIVEADTGIMGGQLSEEFQAIAPVGEDTIVICKSCDYASNHEVAETKAVDFNHQERQEQLEKIYTPNVKTIEDVAKFLDVHENQLLKTLIYKYNDELIAVLLNGTHELNELKLTSFVNAEVEPATDEEIMNIAKSSTGFIGPKGLPIRIVADASVENMKDFVIGANEEDHHIKHVNLEDFEVEGFFDLRLLEESDVCPNCGGELEFDNAIEVGNIFKLGTTYSEAFDLVYSDQNNKLHPVVMGSYGIGIGRTLAAIAETHSDEHGLNFPIEIAPYKVAIVIIGTKDEEQMAYANELYEKLEAMGIETILDDRNERPGVKFNDMELIGVPLRVTVGRGLADGVVEFKLRSDQEASDIKIEDIVEHINTIIEKLKK